jgi:hypothetical protein
MTVHFIKGSAGIRIGSELHDYHPLLINHIIAKGIEAVDRLLTNTSSQNAFPFYIDYNSKTGYLYQEVLNWKCIMST